MPSAIGASHASSNSPAHQVRASNPEAKGAEFGALVSAAAKAKHAPTPTVVEPPSAVAAPAEGEADPGAGIDLTV